MNDQLQKFESELRAFIEFKYNSSPAQHTVERFNETEQAVFVFIDEYLLNAPDLTAGDVERSAHNILNDFIASKIK